MSTTNTTTTTPDRKAQAAEAKARSAAAPAAVRAASKSSTASSKARATADDEATTDTRSEAEQTAAAVSSYTSVVVRNEARVSKAEAAFEEIENRILLDGDESAEADLVPARDELGLARLQLQGSRNALAVAEEEHRAATADGITERVVNLVWQMTNPEANRGLRAAVADLLESDRQKAEDRNATISTAVAEAAEAGLPSTSARLDEAQDRWTAKPATIDNEEEGTREDAPVTVVTGAPGRDRYGVTATVRNGVRDGLLVGREYVHVVDPDRAAALAVCRAAGVDIQALETAVRQRSNPVVAYVDVFQSEKLISDAWTTETR